MEESQDWDSRAKGLGKWVKGSRKSRFQILEWQSAESPPGVLARPTWGESWDQGSGVKGQSQVEEPWLGVAIKIPGVIGLFGSLGIREAVEAPGEWWQRAHE